MAERDDPWLLGALAAQDAYRGDDPQWPPAPQPGTVFNSPWERGVAIASDYTGRDTPPASATEAPPDMGSLLGMGRAGETAKSIGEGIARSADYYVGMPSRAMQGVPPETPGQRSESDEFRAQKLADAAYEWAPSTAFGMVFDPLGVKRSVGGVALGSGAGGKIIQREVLPTKGEQVFERAAPKMGELAEQTPIRAYHGSPYDFDRFDLSKIGTGEGAQVYGQGLYFAEAEPVAKSYRDALSGANKHWLVDGDIVGTYGSNSGPMGGAAARLRQVMGRNGIVTTEDASAAMARFAEMNARNKGMIPAASFKEIMDTIPRLVGRNVAESGGGHMYAVDIHAKPEQFLDWDKPLSGQHQNVDVALKSILKDRGRMPAEWIKGSPGAEGRMHEAGIPGIRYLDQGSRLATDDAARLIKDVQRRMTYADEIGASAGAKQKLADELAGYQSKIRNATSNYVVFDPAKIDILRKYGLAGAVPTMGALASQDRYGNEYQQ